MLLWDRASSGAGLANKSIGSAAPAESLRILQQCSCACSLWLAGPFKTHSVCKSAPPFGWTSTCGLYAGVCVPSLFLFLADSLRTKLPILTSLALVMKQEKSPTKGSASHIRSISITRQQQPPPGSARYRVPLSTCAVDSGPGAGRKAAPTRRGCRGHGVDGRQGGSGGVGAGGGGRG